MTIPRDRNEDGSRVPYDCSCGAKPGEHHVPGCSVERCARCGRQAIACPCVYEVNGIDRETTEDTHPDVYHNGPTDEMVARFDALWDGRRIPWSGEYPGCAECREYGFWCIWDERKGWLRVEPVAPGATEDLNRLAMMTDWDVDRQKYVLRGR